MDHRQGMEIWPDFDNIRLIDLDVRVTDSQDHQSRTH